MTIDQEITDVIEMFGSLFDDGTSGSPFPGSTTKKSSGRPKGSLAPHTIAIREAIETLQYVHEVMTVRQVFYALTVRGIVDKTEGGYRQVQRQVLLMRREGVLPWDFIADATRWQRKPTSYRSAKDAVDQWARSYRRNLWQQQKVRVEIWLEKDALAGVVIEATQPWDVALMVSRGQSSDTFCYQAAEAAWHACLDDDVWTQVYALYDFDKSGRDAADAIERKLRDYFVEIATKTSETIADVAISWAPRVDLLAVTEEQIDGWDLPTRPAKENPDEIAVELDAIPPDKLIELVNDAIENHVDAEAWAKQKIAEESEREGLQRLLGGWEAT